MISKNLYLHFARWTLFFFSSFPVLSLAQETFTLTGTNGGNTNAPAGNIRQIIAPPAFTSDANEIRIQLIAPATANLVVVGAYVGEQASTSCPYCMNPATVQPLTFGGMLGTTVPARTSLWSDWMPLYYGHLNTYVVSVGYSSGQNMTWGGNGTVYQLYGAQNIAGEALVPAYVKSSGLSLIVSAVQARTIASSQLPAAPAPPLLHRLEPASGTVLHGAGQDPVSFAAYTHAMGNTPPAIFMSYVDLQDNIVSDFSELTTALGAYSNFLVPQIGLSMMNLTTNKPFDAEVADGLYDSQINSLCLSPQ